jgi:hypothetical protein
LENKEILLGFSFNPFFAKDEKNCKKTLKEIKKE